MANKALIPAFISAIVLSACTSLMESPEQTTAANEFSVYLTGAQQTRVVNDGLSTKWEGGETINLYHAVAGTETYTLNSAFKVEGVSGKFTGNLKTELDEASNYDWYVLFPYNSNIKQPNGTKGNITIGASKGIETQNGYNSMAHLAGKAAFPMAGSVKNVPATEYPTIPLKHIASVIAFNVTNNLDDDIVVNSINISAPKGIVGSFLVDFTKDIFSLKEGSNYSSRYVAQLNVENGATLKKGEKAVFYFGVAPFVAETGTELNYYVNVTAGSKQLTQKYSQVCNESVAFNSGHIKNINMSFSSQGATALTTNHDDFKSFNLGARDTSVPKLYTSFDGWVLTNGYVIDPRNFSACPRLSPVLEGKTTAGGTLVSPKFANGCGTLKIKYGIYNSNDKISFNVIVKDADGKVFKTIPVSQETPENKTEYIFSEPINLSGDFQVEFVNLSPQQSTTTSKDCVAILSVEWTNYPA